MTRRLTGGMCSSPHVQTLERRTLLTIDEVRWEASDGTALIEDTERLAGETVYAAVTTSGMRGQTATVYVVEDDYFFGHHYAYITTLHVPIPADGDTGRVAWRAIWHEDAGGLTDEPEFRVVRSLDTSDPVRSPELIVNFNEGPIFDYGSAGTVKWGATSHTFTAGFRDVDPVNGSSLNAGDFRVTGPSGFEQIASFVSRSPNSGNASDILATYSFMPPGGSWDWADNGTYYMTSQSNQVFDVAGHAHGGGYWWKLVVDLPVAPAKATIRATVYHDKDGGNRFDKGDEPMPGRLVFLDLNRNKRLDPTEPKKTTDTMGRAIFGDVAPGTYDVRLAGREHWVDNGGATALKRITVTAGQNDSATKFGTFKDAGGDPDDRIGEVARAASRAIDRAHFGVLDTTTDVDLFKFEVGDWQTIAFDVDLVTGLKVMFNSRLRLFDADGSEVAFNRDTPPVRDRIEKSLAFDGSKSAFAEHLFARGGTYYVGVSGSKNGRYNPHTGSGDAAALGGRYSLRLTRVTRIHPHIAQPSQIAGTLRLPNGGIHLNETLVSLTRHGGGAIAFDKKTWIVIHGRQSNPDSFHDTAAAMDSVLGDDHQVLLLDWRAGSEDNLLAWGPAQSLEGSAWAEPVGLWAASVLAKVGLTTDAINLVGHSWGTYVAHEIADATPGGVNRLVALDPAFEGVGARRAGLAFDTDEIDFAGVSKWSWAFFGDGAFGSARLSGKADEAFTIDYKGTSDVFPVTRHTAPVWLFNALLTDTRTDRSWGNTFTLSHLLATQTPTWQVNRYRESAVLELDKKVFEGRFKLRLNDARTNIASIEGLSGIRI